MKVEVRAIMAIGVGLAVVLAGALWGTQASLSVQTTQTTPIITISRSSCGTGWTSPHPGEQTFEIRNSDNLTTEVTLIDPHTQTIFSELEGLAAATTRTMRVVLGNGDYAFRCLADGEEGVTGPTIRLTGGSNRSSPAIAPVTYNDLLQPLKQYRGYVISGLNTLATDARDISDQRTWLAAHLDYERLGAAYGTFGDADQAIQNAFQAIEKDLWQGGSTIQADVAALNSAISSLQKDFPSAQIDPMDLGLRAHEILENAVQFELTEKTDNGSNTNLRTVSANIDGTKEILTVLRPLLATRYPALPQVDAALNAEQQLIDSSPPLNQISTMQREKINGGISNLTELLAPIAAICEPRRTQ